MLQADHKYEHIMVLMAWFWAINLIFFPTWLFGHGETQARIVALALVLGWFVISCVGLWLWFRFSPSQVDNRAASLPTYWPDKRQSAVVWLCTLLVGAINLIPATYPLTTSGDERHHANMFQSLGQIVRRLIEPVLPGPVLLWTIVGVVGFVLLMFGWWRLVHTQYRKWVLRVSMSVLLIGIIVSIPVAFGVIDRLVSSSIQAASADGYTTQASGAARQLVRFQPLTKFLWLPFSTCCGNSLFALRLPVLLCGLLAVIVMHYTISLRERSWLSIWPALYLLVLPGMFYFGHVVYLTTPMLLTWAIALYFYERYNISKQTHFLIFTAMALNVGTFVRLETGYFSLGLLAHWGLMQLLARNFSPSLLTNGLGIGWFGVSLVPLWGQLSVNRPFVLNIEHWLNPNKLFAIANDYPYHIGPIATLLLVFAIVAILVRPRQVNYSGALLGVSLSAILVTYLLYTVDFLVNDTRQLGVFPLSREWQTANRFLVSWSPFVVILLAEGVARFPWPKARMAVGAVVAVALFAQATFWAGPLTLPDYTSIWLRPNVEFPHLPTDEAIKYISEELATPETTVLFSVDGSAEYYVKALPTQGNWRLLSMADRGTLNQDPDMLIEYCEKNNVNLILMPLVSFDSIGTPILTMYQEALASEHFEIKRVFDHLGQPALVVAEYLPSRE